jgi:hypothetical protein
MSNSLAARITQAVTNALGHNQALAQRERRLRNGPGGELVVN